MSFEGSRAVLVKDLSGNILSISGGAIAVGGSINATASISGQTVVLAGGSGQNAAYITNQSGNVPANVINNNLAVAISDDGTSVASVAVQADNFFAFNAVGTLASLFGWADTQGRFNRIRTTESGTIASQGGTGFRLLTDTTQVGLTVRRIVPAAATALSGGTSLGSGVVVHGIKLKHLTSGEGNPISGMVYVGGSGTGLAPFSGVGYPLSYGETLELKIGNLNSVRVVSTVSGSLVSAIGVDF